MKTVKHWYVSRLRVENFRCFARLDLELAPDLTLLVGLNGAGKTAVLDAIAVALGTPMRELSGEKQRGILQEDVRVVPFDLDSHVTSATVEPQYPVSVAVEAALDGHDVTWERRRDSASGNTKEVGKEVHQLAAAVSLRATGSDADARAQTLLPVISYYGIERLVKIRSGHGEIQASRKHAYASALEPGSDLTRLNGFLAVLDGQIQDARVFGDENPEGAINQFRAIDLACERVLETVGWRRLRWNRAIGQLTLSHSKHGTLPLSYLATGTKIAAGMAIDLASRMARANPQLGASELLELTPGIVMIDEVDMHLHPSWQQRIVPALRRVFPRVQFILTTHSPQVISTVEADRVRILDGRGVSAPQFSQGLRANVVLEEVQGVNPAPDVEIRATLGRYMQLVHAGEGKGSRARELRGQLDDTLGGADFEEELRRADIAMEFSDWDD
ncbi:AAA family ATPase [Leucobacter sp. HY1908]